MKQAQYIIGIDLGTTNSTMAYSHIGGEDQAIHQFSIPQITINNMQSDGDSLPSFIYHLLPEEIKSGAAALEWCPDKKHCVGVFARDKGSELPARLITSAKSWLCHAGINRKEKLLPQGEEKHLSKMSPLEACSEFLIHLREAWDFKMPKAPLKKQQVLITVPASFDPSARQLVQEAAELAGFPQVILLEEPQAAFYSWIHGCPDWRKILKVGDKVLVVDIGGGTTDFSLISVGQEDGNLHLERVAVGAHLLLGGDNLDLSLAYLAKTKLEASGSLIDEWQFKSLVHACRQAKETLLGSNPPSQADVTIMGRGSKLIGGTLKIEISQEEISKLIIDGYMPKLSPKEQSLPEKRSGLQQIGLPYAQDPRITCQLAKFLSLTGDSEKNSLDRFILPTAVLYNGGTMKSASLQARLLDVLNGWSQELGGAEVRLLEGADLDFAVSRGAVYYGLARLGKGIRIKSGTNRSYFIGIEEAMPAVPGIPAALKAVCVVPFGMEEGTEKELENQEFALVLGEPATFRFFSRGTNQLTDGSKPEIGTCLKNWKSELTELPTIETQMDKSDEDGKTVKVTLKSKFTELGVLELWCAAQDGRTWKLEFDTRH